MASPSPPPRGSRCKQCGRTRTVHAQDRHGDRRRNFLKKWKRRGRKGPRRPPPTFGIPGDANEKKEKRMRIESAKVWYSVNEQKKHTHNQPSTRGWKRTGWKTDSTSTSEQKKTIKERVLKRTAKTNSGGEKKTLKRWEKKDVPPPFFFKPPSFQLFVICYLWLEAVEAKKTKNRRETSRGNEEYERDLIEWPATAKSQKKGRHSTRRGPLPFRVGWGRTLAVAVKRCRPQPRSKEERERERERRKTEKKI